ncbi:MAG: vanadium-dependent haloperoxidase [Saprospiraceae bacterium]|nr:vanadium-dependent haloperoxidase [Saprospiraceae bacterium]
MHYFTKKSIGLWVVFVSVLWLFSCKDTDPAQQTSKVAKEYDHKVMSSWNDLFLEIERYAAGYRPGPAPRAIAYIGLAAYEGCIAGMPEYNSMESLYPGLDLPSVEPNQEYHWPSVVNASTAYLMRKFFEAATSERLAKIDALENQNASLAQNEASQDVIDRSKAYGIAVATAMWQYAVSDPVGHDHYKDPFQGYNWQDHYSKDGDWKPTFPGPGKPMGGVWGGARTFAIGNADKICRPPLTYSASPSSELYSQALEVYAQNTPTLSYEDEWVGEFWSDDLLNLTFSPGPRWLAVGNQVLNLEDSNLETAIFMTVKVGMALNDAAVACWSSKYHYNVERPQTYINRVIDPSWKPALYNPITGDIGVTPSFPAYPSGHSSMGAAGAEALASIFGYAYAMTDRCHETRTEFAGTPRTFGSFFEMAQENAWSRVPLGVHFRMDCDEGVRFGTVIGRKVNDLPWKK